MSIDLVGKKFGTYQIVSRLGRGGMGVVYKAHQASLNRDVALKVLPAHMSGDDFKRRFLREAQIAAHLNHPNIVTIYDYGEVDEMHFLAMELIQGKNLIELIRERGHIATRDALRFTAPVAEALAVAHDNNIIHRDIKPMNIMWDERTNVVKVLDFGIAKMNDDTATQLTLTGTVLGTPEYMSPEQCEGHELTGQSDLYSLGITLYYMLAGRAPFSGPNPLAVIRRILDQPVPPLSDFNPSIPNVVQSVVDRALAKSPEARFSTGYEFKQAIEFLLDLDARGEIDLSKPQHVDILVPGTVSVSLPMTAGAAGATAASSDGPMDTEALVSPQAMQMADTQKPSMEATMVASDRTAPTERIDLRKASGGGKALRFALAAVFLTAIGAGGYVALNPDVISGKAKAIASDGTGESRVTSEPTPEFTPAPTETPQPSPTATPEVVATTTPEPTLTPDSLGNATPEPIATVSPVPTASPTATPTPTPEPPALAELAWAQSVSGMERVHRSPLELSWNLSGGTKPEHYMVSLNGRTVSPDPTQAKLRLDLQEYGRKRVEIRAVMADGRRSEPLRMEFDYRNDPPVLERQTPSDEIVDLTEGDIFTFDVKVNDPEGESVELAYRMDDGAWQTLDSSQHTLEGLSMGRRKLQVRAQDPAGQEQTVAWWLDVSPKPTATPTPTPTPVPVEQRKNEKYVLVLEARDVVEKIRKVLVAPKDRTKIIGDYYQLLPASYQRRYPTELHPLLKENKDALESGQFSIEGIRLGKRLDDSQFEMQLGIRTDDRLTTERYRLKLVRENSQIWFAGDEKLR